MCLKQVLLSSIAAVAGSTTVATAHASWIAQLGGDYVVVHGEGSATIEAYDPTIVTDAKGSAFISDPTDTRLINAQS